LIDWLAAKEFWFFWHTHVANEGASDGHNSSVMPSTTFDSSFEAHGARSEIWGMSVMYTETGFVGVGKATAESWLQYAFRTVAADD